MRITPNQPPAQVAAISREPAPKAAPEAAKGPGATDGAFHVPDAPPAALLEQIERASRRVDELDSAGLRMAYEIDPETGRLAIELRGPTGVVDSLEPSRALDIASGAPVG